MGIYERDYIRDDDFSLAPSWNNRSAVEMLIIANVAVWVANAVFGHSASRYDPGRINDLLMMHRTDMGTPYLWWRFLSYSFTHNANDIFHLLFNMGGLYFLGRQVEYRYGKNEFLRIYAVAAILGAIVWAMRENFFGKVSGGLLGASGAVICIEMLFVLNFPRSTVTFLVFPMPAWVLGILLVLLNFSAASSVVPADLTLDPNKAPVAYDVHVIGITCALLYFFGGLNFYGFDDPRGFVKRTWRRWMGPKLKLLHPADESFRGDSESEADRILAKIHEQGQDSLTSKERKFLEKYSQSVRKRKETIDEL